MRQLQTIAFVNHQITCLLMLTLILRPMYSLCVNAGPTPKPLKENKTQECVIFSPAN